MRIFYLTCALLAPTTIVANPIEPFYMDPFDLAAGGTGLTHATQEGILANNAAELPYGNKFIRWFGTKTTIAPGQESLSLTQGLSGSQEEGASSIFDTLNEHPLHLGIQQSLSLLTKYFGFAAVASTTPDIRAWQAGDPQTGAGTPSIVIQNDTYAGAYASFALRPYSFLSFGATAKYFLADERREVIDATNQDAQATVAEKFGKMDLSSTNKGLGIDVSSLLFLQGTWADIRIGVTAQNFGNMKMIGKEPVTYPQIFNVGTSFTLHTEASAIHFMLDLRDATNTQKNLIYDRVYLGTKVLLFTYLGLATGVYHGAPTYGAEIDFLLFRIAATTYIRPYGPRGVDDRSIYMGSISLGVSF